MGILGSVDEVRQSQISIPVSKTLGKHCENYGLRNGKRMAPGCMDCIRSAVGLQWFIAETVRNCRWGPVLNS